MQRYGLKMSYKILPTVRSSLCLISTETWARGNTPYILGVWGWGMLPRSRACQQESMFSDQPPVPKMLLHRYKAARAVWWADARGLPSGDGTWAVPQPSWILWLLSVLEIHRDVTLPLPSCSLITRSPCKPPPVPVPVLKRAKWASQVPPGCRLGFLVVPWSSWSPCCRLRQQFFCPAGTEGTGWNRSANADRHRAPL